MICAVHQPQTFPWLGYFAKIMQADTFVILDNVQFKKNEWQNRNRIKSANGPQWLTVPVIHHFGQLIKDVRINDRINWRNKHIQALKSNYSKAPYFHDYLPELEQLYEQDWQYLAEFNLTGIRWILEKLNVAKPLKIASQIKELQNRDNLGADERLIFLTQIHQADTYLSGAGGRDYLDTRLFPKNNIRLIFQHFEHPGYSQQYGDFISHLSVLDLIFNAGPAAYDIIQEGIR